MRRLLVVIGIASSLGSAIPAHADPNVDANFVDALNKAGITFNDSKSAVNAGKTACGLMDQGKPELDVVQLVMQQNSGISTVSAATTTAAAHRLLPGMGWEYQAVSDRSPPVIRLPKFCAASATCDVGRLL